MTFYKEVKTARDGQLCHYRLPVYMSVPVSECETVSGVFYSTLWILQLRFFPPEIFPIPSTVVVQTSDLGCTGMAQNNHKRLPNLRMHKL